MITSVGKDICIVLKDFSKAPTVYTNDYFDIVPGIEVAKRCPFLENLASLFCFSDQFQKHLRDTRWSFSTKCLLLLVSLGQLVEDMTENLKISRRNIMAHERRNGMIVRNAVRKCIATRNSFLTFYLLTKEQLS